MKKIFLFLFLLFAAGANAQIGDGRVYAHSPREEYSILIDSQNTARVYSYDTEVYRFHDTNGTLRALLSGNIEVKINKEAPAGEGARIAFGLLIFSLIIALIWIRINP